MLVLGADSMPIIAVRRLIAPLSKRIKAHSKIRSYTKSRTMTFTHARFAERRGPFVQRPVVYED
jgi:hypothetical protein